MTVCAKKKKQLRGGLARRVIQCRTATACHVRQLVVWAIIADRAAGVHGSRADSSPPVAHFPSPLYVRVFYSSL